MPTRPILAVDPGLRALGVAILTPSGTLRHAEVIAVSKTLPFPVRLRRIGQKLDELLRLYRPRLLLLEATWPSRHRSVAVVHQVARLLRRHAHARRVRVATVPVSTVRRQLVGSGWAGKQEVAHVIAACFPELRLYLRQDRAWKERHFQNLFDAVALGLVGAGRPPFRTPRHRSR